jgi:hypothetical protein
MLACTFPLISDALSIASLAERTDEMMDIAMVRLFSALAAWEMAPDWELIMQRSMDSMRRAISIAATRAGVRAAAELEGGGVTALEMEPTRQRHSLRHLKRAGASAAGSAHAGVGFSPCPR